MAWTTSTKRQRSWVGKTEAKASGRRALRLADKAEVIYDELVDFSPDDWDDDGQPRWNALGKIQGVGITSGEALAEMRPEYEPLVEWNGMWMPQWKVDRIKALVDAADAEARGRYPEVFGDVPGQEDAC